MSFKGLFVGINRYSDPQIRDLQGARWDAIALAALFEDTFPGIEVATLLDEQATLAALRQALEHTLASAGVDDVVFFAFSGHGSPDHRIVAHDTELVRPETALPMGDLAAAFRASPARALVCVLDCCFSGGAPA